MRKILITLSLVIILTLIGCTSNTQPVLKGGYQNERGGRGPGGIGYAIVISFESDNNGFVEYIENVEVDKGTYTKIKNNIYELKSDKQKFKINLNSENTFEVIVKNINKGKPIQLKNTSDVPVVFLNHGDDDAKYKALLD